MKAQDQDAPVMAPNSSTSYDSKAQPDYAAFLDIKADAQAKVITGSESSAARVFAVSAGIADSTSALSRDKAKIEVLVGPNALLRTSSDDFGTELQGKFSITVTSDLRLRPASKKGQKSVVILLGDLSTDKTKLVAVQHTYVIPLGVNDSFPLTEVVRRLDRTATLHGKGVQIEIVGTAPLIQTGQMVSRSEMRVTYEIGTAGRQAQVETFELSTN